MQRFFILCLFFYIGSSLSAQPYERYSIIDLQLDHKEDVGILLDLGIAADHVHPEHTDHLELFINQRERKILLDNGFTFSDVIADTKLYADKIAASKKQPSYKSAACGVDRFTLGSIAGYHDYEEIVTILQNIITEFPQLTKLSIIGRSHEGRDIIALKISDNAAMDESATEPAAYYDALTHAREPLSMMSTLYYISWLLENYNDPDELAKFYIDNREIHFVLVVNPDGYVYNTETAPNGGGGWRKNRRTINDECIGVDLNRNYAAQWEGPGSHSVQPCSDIYRGETANSELETQAIQNYLDEIKPKSAFSSHSFSQVMIDPNKKVGDPNYNFGQYADYASEFTPPAYRGYGSADDLIGYLASGTTLDYLHEQGAVAWTPEIGTIFWEAEEDICGYTQEMLEPMKFITKIAGVAPSYHNHHVSTEEKIINGNSIELTIDVINKGLTSDAEEISVELNPLSSAATVQNRSIKYSAPAEGKNSYGQSEKFILEILDAQVGSPIPFELKIKKNNVLTEKKEIFIYPGEYTTLFDDDMESGLDKWTRSSNQEVWSISDIDSKSGDNSLVDSKLAYAPGTVSIIQTANAISLVDQEDPWLFFDIKYSLRPTSAILRVLVSSDAINWRVVQSDGMGRLRSNNSFTGNYYWSKEFVDLSDFASEQEALYIRFELTTTETSNTSDGAYVDDVKILNFLNSNETTPVEEEIQNEDISIYPNPTTDQITISAKSIADSKLDVVIYNSLGHIVKYLKNKPISTYTVVNLRDIPSGLYTIQLRIGDNMITKKIIKTNSDQ